MLALDCVVFNAASVKFCTLSEPAFGNAEQESLLDCLGILWVGDATANKEIEKIVVAKNAGRANMMFRYKGGTSASEVRRLIDASES